MNQLERVGTFCEKCRQVVCICDKFPQGAQGSLSILSPKEEAKILIDSFRKYVDSETAGQDNFVFSKMQETTNAKECALILAKTTIRVLQGNHIFNAGIIENWEEIKSEIEKY